MDVLEGIITRLLVINYGLVPFGVLHKNMFRAEAYDRELTAYRQAHDEVLHSFLSYFNSIELLHAIASVHDEEEVEALRWIRHRLNRSLILLYL